MKKALALATTLLTTSFAVSGEIPDSFKHSKPNNFYFGVISQQLDLVDSPSNQEVNAQTLGGTFGVYLTSGDWGSVALDTFFSRTINADKLESNNREANVNIGGGFFAYRMPTKIYGKAKIGAVSTELDNISSADGDGLEFSWGAGLGIEVFYGVDLEVEFTELRDGVDAASISLIFND